jgi:hemerythrin-like metal-binding protein
MEDFSLKREYLLGNALLDEQHEAILGYLGAMYENVLAGKASDELFAVIETLDAYFKLHFVHEEAMLEEIGSMDLKEHVVEDAIFIRHLATFFAEMRDKPSTTHAVDKILFLKGWFLEHIGDLVRKHGHL